MKAKSELIVGAEVASEAEIQANACVQQQFHDCFFDEGHSQAGQQELRQLCQSPWIVVEIER